MLCVQQHPYVRVIGSLAFFLSFFILRVTVGDASARRYQGVREAGGAEGGDLVPAVRV